MKASDLRIGNYVYNLNGDLREIAGVSFDDVYLKSDKYRIDLGVNWYNVKPIPLTEEWLEKFGATVKHAYKGYTKEIDSSEYRLGDYQITWNKYVKGQPERYSVWHMEPNGKDFNSCIASVLYVHQLQNLYFALTGEELKIKNKVS